MFDASGNNFRRVTEKTKRWLQSAPQLPSPRHWRKPSKKRVRGHNYSQSEVSETSARVFLIPEGMVHHLIIECLVREICPTRERLVGNIGRSLVPQSRLATVHDVRSVNKTNMPDDELLFPASTVILGLERVYANLRLEEAGVTRAAGED